MIIPDTIPTTAPALLTTLFITAFIINGLLKLIPRTINLIDSILLDLLHGTHDRQLIKYAPYLALEAIYDSFFGLGWKRPGRNIDSIEWQ